MKKTILFFVLVMSQIALAQNTSLLRNIEIKDSNTIIKYVSVDNCKTIVKAGNTLKTESTKQGENETFTITKEEKLTTNKTITTKRTIAIKMTGFGGKASLYTKEGKHGKTYVDFWLNPFNTVKKGVTVVEISKKLSCTKFDANNPDPYDYTKGNKTILKKKATYSLLKIAPSVVTAWGTNIPDWYIHTDKIIEVYKADNVTIDYYLVNKYDRNALYELKFKNREYISFRTSKLEIGPLTIPFKYRYGFRKDTASVVQGNKTDYVDVNQEAIADFNVGIFAGWKVHQFGIRNEHGTSIQQPGSAITVGTFINLSAVTLNKGNTRTTALITDDSTQTIASLSTGLSVMIDIQNFNFGLFLGRDLGFGSKAKEWDFNNRNWLGVGIGYNLNGFKKKE
jgi:hypothetical protein